MCYKSYVSCRSIFNLNRFDWQVSRQSFTVVCIIIFNGIQWSKIPDRNIIVNSLPEAEYRDVRRALNNKTICSVTPRNCNAILFLFFSSDWFISNVVLISELCFFASLLLSIHSAQRNSRPLMGNQFHQFFKHWNKLKD